MVFMRNVYRLLNPGGNFLFEMPNVNDPLLALYSNDAYHKFYWYPFHLFFYSPKTIAKLFSSMFNMFNVQVLLKQRYGIINHLRWVLRGKPGNFNAKIPILDSIYEKVLKSYNMSDTLIITGSRKT
jgi:hypothetical protein